MRITAVLFAAMATLLGVGAAAAIEAPSGPALVTISGSIANTNLDGKLVLDEKAIEALPFTTVRTETPWTEGVVTFEGVPLKALLTSPARPAASCTPSRSTTMPWTFPSPMPTIPR